MSRAASHSLLTELILAPEVDDLDPVSTQPIAGFMFLVSSRTRRASELKQEMVFLMKS